MPQLDFDGANSKISADKIQGQSGTTVTIPAGHNLAGDGSGLTNLPAHSGNVAFPATQVASANANTLDDYEEGSWTPILGGSTTYNENGGHYIKIGRFCICHGILRINAIGTGATYTISGLPFTSAGATNVNDAPGGFSIGEHDSLATSVIDFSCNNQKSSTSVIVKSKTVAATANAINAIFQNNTRMNFTVYYLTA